MLAAIGAPAKVQVFRDAPEWFHPGRSARLWLGPKKTLAVFGELHPRVLDRQLDVKGPAVAFTIYPAEVPCRARRARAARRWCADLQAVERDFAFVVDAGSPAQDVVNAAAGADKALIEDVRVFDEFIGPGRGADGRGQEIARHHGAPATHRQDPDRSRDRGGQRERSIDKVAKATGGSLRG